jgi:hypothetical protein
MNTPFEMDPMVRQRLNVRTLECVMLTLALRFSPCPQLLGQGKFSVPESRGDSLTLIFPRPTSVSSLTSLSKPWTTSYTSPRVHRAQGHRSLLTSANLISVPRNFYEALQASQPCQTQLFKSARALNPLN